MVDEITQTSQFKHWFSHMQSVVSGGLDFKDSQKYIKIISYPYKDHPNEQRGVFAFIDKSNGDILKPASWNAPAKHARGNLFDKSGGLSGMTPYGPAYLK